MPRIDFYTLEPGSPGDRFLLTCRLVERIRASGLRALIHCPDGESARHIDRLLWTFKQESFVPHGIVGRGVDSELTPVLISGDGSPAGETQVLINLSLEIPPFFDRFERVCEPVDRSPEHLSAGRARFKQYRERGFPPEHHGIRLGSGEQDSW